MAGRAIVEVADLDMGVAICSVSAWPKMHQIGQGSLLPKKRYYFSLVADVTLYTKRMCRHSLRARRRLRRHGATIHEIRATVDVARMRAELRDRFGADTFPQIVIGERHIGGADDLVRLDKSGELARLLAE